MVSLAAGRELSCAAGVIKANSGPIERLVPEARLRASGTPKIGREFYELAEFALLCMLFFKFIVRFSPTRNTLSELM